MSQYISSLFVAPVIRQARRLSRASNALPIQLDRGDTGSTTQQLFTAEVNGLETESHNNSGGHEEQDDVDGLVDRGPLPSATSGESRLESSRVPASLRQVQSLPP